MMMMMMIMTTLFHPDNLIGIDTRKHCLETIYLFVESLSRLCKERVHYL